MSESGTPTGEDMTSTNFKACAGFQCLKDELFLTFVLATSGSACTQSTTGGTLTIALGTLTTASVFTGSTHVCINVETNATNGVVVTVTGAAAGLTSTSVPGDDIDSADATLAGGTEGYGVCSTNTDNFTVSSPFNGSCDDSSGHAVGGPTTSAQTVYSATGPVNAFGDMLAKATISSLTVAHDDYTDSLTYIATATY